MAKNVETSGCPPSSAPPLNSKRPSCGMLCATSPIFQNSLMFEAQSYPRRPTSEETTFCFFWEMVWDSSTKSSSACAASTSSCSLYLAQSVHISAHLRQRPLPAGCTYGQSGCQHLPTNQHRVIIGSTRPNFERNQNGKKIKYLSLSLSRNHAIVGRVYRVLLCLLWHTCAANLKFRCKQKS